MGGGAGGRIGKVAVTQGWTCTVPHPGTQAMVQVGTTVVDTFAAENSSISITTSITTDRADVPFTTQIQTPLHWSRPAAPAAPAPDRVWLPWTKGCVNNDGRRPGMCYGTGPLRNALPTEPMGDGFYRYGGNGAGSNDSFSVPVATVLDTPNGVGITLAVSPEDPVMELYLNTTADGVVFQRELLRIGQGRALSFTAHVVGHAACWRPGLSFMAATFAPFFEPWADDIVDFEGLGSYSWNQAPYNVSRGKALGFKTNWDLSGTFMPYDGLFLPYQDEWLNLGPINGGLAQYNVTYPMINKYYDQIQAAGFHSLSYFDIGNWGVSVNSNYRGPNTTCGTRPNGLPAPCPDRNGGNEFLRDHLWPALLHHGWDTFHGKRMVHRSDWVGTTDMDPMVPYFEDLLVEQLERHVDKITAFEGIAIDRLDYTESFNYDRDDNVSWVPVNGTGVPGAPRADLTIWGAARSLRTSNRHTFNRLHEVLHPKAAAGRGEGAGGDGKKNRVMYINCNWLCRLDEMRSFDGTFNEGAALNSVAFTGLRNPTIMWTYGLEPNTEALDTFFQQHLLMDVYPMAPMPKNDHSITPGSPVVEQAYYDYGPLFDAMHGARWLLSSNPVHVAVAPTPPAPAGAAVNVFTLPSGGPAAAATTRSLLVPIVLAGANATSATLSLNLVPTQAELGWAAATAVSGSALHPGQAHPVALGQAKQGPDGAWQLVVPLARGMALVTATITV